MTTQKKVKIDEKQKKTLMDAIFNDYPMYRMDKLKYYEVERMVEAYLTDSDTFNKEATRLQKLEKKGELPKPKGIPEELVCISKISADGIEEKPQEFKVDGQGMIIAA